MTNAQRGAAIGGVALAVGSVFVSFGASIVSMVAIWIAWAVYRRREKPLTRGVSWLVGFGAVGTVVVMVFGFFVLTRVPSSTLADVKRAMDSAAATPQPPPPEWLRKMTPPHAQQQTKMMESVFRSGAFTLWTGVMGVTFMAAIVAAYAGTLGWAASMLLAYGVTGAWFPRGETDPSLVSAPPLPRRSTRAP